MEKIELICLTEEERQILAALREPSKAGLLYAMLAKEIREQNEGRSL